jgi:tRNA (guanine37-N1)-methyltransferase
MKTPKSFDQVGTIAIFNEFPRKNRDKIAKSMLNQRIRTVALKTKSHSGKLRLPKIKILAGDKTKETIHKENGVLLKTHIEKCYFSVRSSNERLRIAKLVNDNESILVMFSGIAPFPLVIEKNANPKEIYAIELNKKCHKYATENLKLNKSKKVYLIKGNVKKALPKLNKSFDRILMPHPSDSFSYLDLALKYISPKGTIHFYIFGQEKEISELKKKITSHSEKIKIKNVIKAGYYAPYTYRLCFDLAII